jgi:hypothetical protein
VRYIFLDGRTTEISQPIWRPISERFLPRVLEKSVELRAGFPENGVFSVFSGKASLNSAFFSSTRGRKRSEIGRQIGCEISVVLPSKNIYRTPSPPYLYWSTHPYPSLAGPLLSFPLCSMRAHVHCVFEEAAAPA